MHSKTVLSQWPIFILFLHGITIATAWNVNLTNFGNCGTGEQWESSGHTVLVKDIIYHIVNGFCDTITGTYVIPTVNTAEKFFEITMFRCPTASTGQCNDNAEVFVEHMHCDRFQTDITGPWFMLSDAMTGSKCGELEGEFKLDNACLKPEYLTQFMVADVEHARHRMKILILKKGNIEAENVVRACINVEFDLVF